MDRKILIVDDEADIRDILQFNLENAGYFIVGLFIIFFLPPANSFCKNFKPAVWNLLTALILLVCSVFSFNKISPFIYFNF